MEAITETEGDLKPLISTKSCDISFRHYHRSELTSGRRKWSHLTVCVIKVKGGLVKTRSGENTDELKGLCKCSREDMFSRKEGRRRAFERAVLQLESKVQRMLLRKPFNEREGLPFTD